MTTATATQVKIKNILFATDFSPASNRAIPYIKNLARHYKANIFAVHVRPPVVNPMTPPASWQAEIETAKVVDEEHRKELLESFEDLPTNVLIQEGPFESLLTAAIRRNDIDLVVIGTRGRTGVGKLLLGSIAEEILRTIDCPVLTVGPQADSSRTIPGEFTEIVCATDPKSEPNEMAEYAVSLAQQFRARIALVHVVPNPDPHAPERYDVGDSARELLKTLVPLGVEVVSKPEYFVKAGDPAER